MSEGNPLDHPGPWDADVTTVLQSAGFEDGGISWPGPIRRLMSEAWRYGYTTGMADAAKFEEQAAAVAKVAEELPEQAVATIVVYEHGVAVNLANATPRMDFAAMLRRIADGYEDNTIRRTR